MSTIIYCDGGCRNNGALNVETYGSFSVNGQIHRVRLDCKTNNESEYMVLIECLEWCQSHQIHAPIIHMDSQLVVEQVSGRWQPRAANLKPMCELARQLLADTHAALGWVGRDEVVARLGH